MLKTGDKVKLRNVEGNESTATLIKIDKYSSGLPDDYMFQFDEGEVELLKNDFTYPLFPLPVGLVKIMLEKGIMTKVD